MGETRELTPNSVFRGLGACKISGNDVVSRGCRSWGGPPCSSATKTPGQVHSLADVHNSDRQQAIRHDKAKCERAAATRQLAQLLVLRERCNGKESFKNIQRQTYSGGGMGGGKRASHKIETHARAAKQRRNEIKTGSFDHASEAPMHISPAERRPSVHASWIHHGRSSERLCGRSRVVVGFEDPWLPALSFLHPSFTARHHRSTHLNATFR